MKKIIIEVIVILFLGALCWRFSLNSIGLYEERLIFGSLIFGIMAILAAVAIVFFFIDLFKNDSINIKENKIDPYDLLATKKAKYIGFIHQEDELHTVLIYEYEDKQIQILEDENSNTIGISTIKK